MQTESLRNGDNTNYLV